MGPQSTASAGASDDTNSRDGRSPRVAEHEEVTRRLQQAMQEGGICYLRGHAIPQELPQIGL